MCQLRERSPRIQILTVEGLLSGTERIDASPQLNPFAMAARESAAHKQTEMRGPLTSDLC